jgi:hypothetical protein
VKARAGLLLREQKCAVSVWGLGARSIRLVSKWDVLRTTRPTITDSPVKNATHRRQFGRGGERVTGTKLERREPFWTAFRYLAAMERSCQKKGVTSGHASEAQASGGGN